MDDRVVSTRGDHFDDSCDGDSGSRWRPRTSNGFAGLSLEQAEALTEALLDLRTPDDLKAWLATQDASSA